jgi:hypothetical protein
METIYKPTKHLKLTLVLLIAVGAVAVIVGFITDPARTWSNVLLNNMYFLTISIGAMLFYSIQYITGSTWSAMIQRIPLSLGAFIPPAMILMLLLYFGLSQVYEWAIPGITETDKLIAHKSPFLNVPFYLVRIVIYFALWIPLVLILRQYAVQEDVEGGTLPYKKSKYYAKVFIFVASLFFSMAAIDWVMTLDAHWYSTLFGFRSMVTSIYFAVAVIILVLFFLKQQGYFPGLNMAHRNDLARYLFRFSIVFGYLWFMQFLILWYANIPELTVYYSPRFLGPYKFLFYAEVLMNFAIPFVVLLSDDIGRRPMVMVAMSGLLVVGLWVSLYMQIMPANFEQPVFGFIEIGMWLGYAGLFLLLAVLALSRSLLIPENHPMIQESKHHHL